MKKSPARKRKMEVKEAEEQSRRMKRMLDRWKKREKVEDVDSDSKTVTNLKVDDVAGQTMTRKKNKVEKSTVQRGLDRFSMMPGDG